jgi:hypothetical protein
MNSLVLSFSLYHIMHYAFLMSPLTLCFLASQPIASFHICNGWLVVVGSSSSSCSPPSTVLLSPITCKHRRQERRCVFLCVEEFKVVFSPERKYIHIVVEMMISRRSQRKKTFYFPPLFVLLLQVYIKFISCVVQ